MRFRPVLLAFCVTFASCDQAQRYPSVAEPPKTLPLKKPQELHAHWSWMRPMDVPVAVPIGFVPSSAPDWESLPKFWNQVPPPFAGRQTIHLGLPPLQAIAAMLLADQIPTTIRIKVPPGLPDPNPFIPAANQPTYAKWRLGKKLFFAPVLKSGDDAYACATCHRPTHGFAEARARTLHGTLNTPGLINVVYNRSQFWDGRVNALEEVVVRSLEDERPAIEAPQRREPEISHVWGGLVLVVGSNPAYVREFEHAFGITAPTQDAIAKALATYMRTILSGDSLVDRAQAQRQRARAESLTAAHFLAALDDAGLLALGDGKLAREEAARRLARGDELFHGKAKCAVCHHGPLFTDHDFHNVGLNPNDSVPPHDQPRGRIVTVPIGLKETRLVGAYRTPSLRALPRTAPYFHDGKRDSLPETVRFYARDILDTPFLPAALRQGDGRPGIPLTDDEIEALVLYLQALDGGPVDSIVAAPME